MSLRDGLPRMPVPEHDDGITLQQQPAIKPPDHYIEPPTTLQQPSIKPPDHYSTEPTTLQQPSIKPPDRYGIEPSTSISIPVPDSPDYIHRIFDSSQVFHQHPRKFNKERDTFGTSPSSTSSERRGICASKISFSGKSPPKLSQRSTTNDMFAALSAHKSTRVDPSRKHLTRRASLGVIDLPSHKPHHQEIQKEIPERDVSSQPNLSATAQTNKTNKMPVKTMRPKLTRSATEPDLMSLAASAETSVSAIAKTAEEASGTKPGVRGRPKLLRRATDTALLKGRETEDHQSHMKGMLKEYYEIVGESRPLSAFFPTHADFCTEMHFYSRN